MTPPTPRPTSSLPFNTPLESGLRSVIILAETSPAGCDLQRLVTYDYFLVHSADIGGPPSLHPASPNRTSELLVRRRLVVAGVELMIRKGLLVPRFERSGVLYYASPLANAFLAYFESYYAERARQAARWLRDAFSRLTDSELAALVSDNLGRWGTEFAAEPSLEEDANV